MPPQRWNLRCRARAFRAFRPRLTCRERGRTFARNTPTIRANCPSPYPQQERAATHSAIGVRSPGRPNLPEVKMRIAPSTATPHNHPVRVENIMPETPEICRRRRRKPLPARLPQRRRRIRRGHLPGRRRRPRRKAALSAYLGAPVDRHRRPADHRGGQLAHCSAINARALRAEPSPRLWKNWPRSRRRRNCRKAFVTLQENGNPLRRTMPLNLRLHVKYHLRR